MKQKKTLWKTFFYISVLDAAGPMAWNNVCLVASGTPQRHTSKAQQFKLVSDELLTEFPHLLETPGIFKENFQDVESRRK